MKRLTLTAFALLASAVLAAAPARAQQTGDADAVRAVINGMFDGMRAGDSTMVRAAFHPTMRLQSVGRREGAVVVREDSADAFVRAVGTPHVEVWDERLGEVEVRVDGDLAQAWMPYTFYRGETLSHCGVNAMHLVRTPQGWKITQITDTRRREGCTPRAAATKGRD